MSKEEIDAQFLNDTLMFSELFAIICGDRMQAFCKDPPLSSPPVLHSPKQKTPGVRARESIE